MQRSWITVDSEKNYSIKDRFGTNDKTMKLIESNYEMLHISISMLSAKMIKITMSYI